MAKHIVMSPETARRVGRAVRLVESAPLNMERRPRPHRDPQRIDPEREDAIPVIVREIPGPDAIFLRVERARISSADPWDGLWVGTGDGWEDMATWFHTPARVYEEFRWEGPTDFRTDILVARKVGGILTVEPWVRVKPGRIAADAPFGGCNPPEPE